MILNVALDTPLRRVFDYRWGGTLDCTRPGLRVRVPFGRRKLLGVLVSVAHDSNVPADKLKDAIEFVDEAPVFDSVTFELLLWAADYYQHPLGEVIATALPVALRAGQAAVQTRRVWTITNAGREQLLRPAAPRATRQLAALAWLAQHAVSGADDPDPPFTHAQLRLLETHGWVTSSLAAPAAEPFEVSSNQPALNEAQRVAVAAVNASLGRFQAHLLFGVTGSGKTEVYLQAIAAATAAGGQALVLVPEIGLTPQLVQRFRRRFSSGVVVLHSALTGNDRRDAWRAAHSGLARIIIGTRSAVFTSLPRLALIVVDEEHDASYKQNEGFRYSARDLAVRRAQGAQVPIVLGSATPSLETLDNVAQARYSKLVLPQRPGAVQAPRMSLVDLRRQPSDNGISQPALQAMSRHLVSGGQVIVFLNRRGYAPSLFCNACGWVAPCAHCDARMTLHRRAAQLRCHHCGARAPIPRCCGSCNQSLNPVGQGTERVEETLTRLFPDAPLARLDRDTATGRGAMEAVLDRVHSGAARILIGTQMLTKGHDFPDVSLVVILDADQGLFASDYRATERLAQTITQVAGRAGRAARAGEVLIQTEFPEHPLLVRLIGEGYEGFASSALLERRAAAWPPYSRLAMLRAEAKDVLALNAFLQAAAEAGHAIAEPSLKILGPAAALVARRADHYRAHLLIESRVRAVLQRFLGRWLPAVESLRGASGMRWSIDVDPLEVD